MRPILQQLYEEALKRYEEDLKKDVAAKEVQTMRAAELEIEEFKQKISQGLMQTYTNVRSQQAAEQMKSCACAKRLPVHEWTSWRHGTLHADVQVKDPYGYCRVCKQSQRPLRGLLGMEPTRWSLEVQRVAVEFGSDHGFGKSQEKMAEHYPNTPIGKSTIRTTVLQHGRQVFDYIVQKLERAADMGLDKPALRPGVAHLEVEYDGSLVRTGQLVALEADHADVPLTAVRKQPKRRRQTEWKQVNLGAVHEPGKVDALYCGRFGQSEAVFDDLFGLACLAGWSMNTDTTGIADGARHIRPNLEERFRVRRPDFVQVPGPKESPFQFILDRPHAKEHLALAGEILAPREKKSLSEWIHEKIQRIDQGQVKEVITYLRRKAKQLGNEVLKDQAEYLERNKDAVDYDRFKAEGRSIASGIVESGHDHVIQERMKLPGTWWHPDNVDPMVALRLLRANHWWDEYWNLQATRYQDKAQQLRQQHLPVAA